MSTSKPASSDPREMSFLDHLEELRWHIFRAVVAIAVMATLVFLNIDFVFDQVLLAPRNPDFFTNHLFCRLAERFSIDALCINSKPFNIININMSGQFSVHIWTSLIGGLILAFPYVIWELWRFISPALQDSERRKTNGILFYISLLFSAGVLFGYYLLTPLSLHFLSSYEVSSQVINQIALNSFISTITNITLASGLVFEMPVLIYFLARLGVVSSAFLRKYRRHSIIVNLVIAAIITPPDVFSQTLVSLPLFALYEVGILVAGRVEKRKLTASRL